MERAPLTTAVAGISQILSTVFNRGYVKRISRQAFDDGRDSRPGHFFEMHQDVRQA